MKCASDRLSFDTSYHFDSSFSAATATAAAADVASSSSSFRLLLFLTFDSSFIHNNTYLCIKADNVK